MSTPRLDQLSREDLYEKVWSAPGTKLSEELAVSDVAISKRCRKLNVPRPPRGYWAKLEAGHRQKRPPLPPTLEQVFVQEAQKPVSPIRKLPAEGKVLHPLAEELLKALNSADLSYDKKRVHLRERALPETEVSKAIAPQVAQAFHALLQVTESRGIKFGRSLSKYDGGHFRRGNDFLYFKIEEDLIEKPEITKRRGSYYGSMDKNKVPCGKLTFTLNPERYRSSGTKRWTSGDKTPLETIVTEVAQFICEHFLEAQKRREEEAIKQEKQRVESEIRWKKRQEEEAIHKQEEKKLKHAQSLERVEQHRKNDLAKAAEWSRLYQSANSFIADCERRWRDLQAGELTEDQKIWLAWAQETAKALSPFEAGYPSPSIDGVFDPAIVPFGGPYPETREFPQPPTMPELPAPVVVEQSYGAHPEHPVSKPFPFWLKYQRK